ncbi:hypothetical protein J2X14_003956 [Pantoea alhagi]|uniref:hypothetical protein n=1 Tax=Mixta sp. BE291 TaxID=3158787 RepID=UPI002866CADC|nr:hypothetical protein [Pantoea alhagi]
MRFFCALALLLALVTGEMSAACANPLTHANPMTNCLNDHILPQMGSNSAPEAIVNRAFLLCKPLVDSWLASYKEPQRQQLTHALRQFYLDRLNVALNRR